MFNVRYEKENDLDPTLEWIGCAARPGSRAWLSRVPEKRNDVKRHIFLRARHVCLARRLAEHADGSTGSARIPHRTAQRYRRADAR